MKIHRVFLIACLAYLSSCQEPERKPADELQSKPLEYAKGFSIEYTTAGAKLLTVTNPWNKGAKKSRYLLYKKDSAVPAGFEDALKIEIPVKSVAVLSSIYAAYVERLGLEEKIKAVSEFRYINSGRLRKRISENKLQELGSNANLNIEKVYTLNPDLIISYASGDPSDEIQSRLSEGGLKLVLCIEQLENTPLGRTEWIKFIAAFFDREQQADSIFELIEAEYIKTKMEAAKAKDCPEVFSDIRYGDVWYMPGGNSYAANLLKDANACYLWKDDHNTGSLPLSFETVFQKAGSAAFWINTGSFTSIGEIVKADPLYENFSAVRNGNVYNNNKRVNKEGGNDYWESGIVSPHLVLADLIRIFHPDLMPDKNLYYYKKLEYEN
jgi:iron complex transport system substrate-binding protein